MEKRKIHLFITLWTSLFSVFALICGCCCCRRGRHDRRFWQRKHQETWLVSRHTSKDHTLNIFYIHLHRVFACCRELPVAFGLQVLDLRVCVHVSCDLHPRGCHLSHHLHGPLPLLHSLVQGNASSLFIIIFHVSAQFCMFLSLKIQT